MREDYAGEEDEWRWEDVGFVKVNATSSHEEASGAHTKTIATLGAIVRD